MALEMGVVNACYRMLHDTFDVKPSEVVGITYDTESDARLAMATAEAAVLLKAQPLLIQNAKLKATGGLINEPPRDLPIYALQGAMEHVDVWIYYNTKNVWSSLLGKVSKVNPTLKWIGLPGFTDSQMVRLVGNVNIPTLSQFMRAVGRNARFGC